MLSSRQPSLLFMAGLGNTWLISGGNGLLGGWPSLRPLVQSCEHKHFQFFVEKMVSGCSRIWCPYLCTLRWSSAMLFSASEFSASSPRRISWISTLQVSRHPEGCQDAALANEFHWVATECFQWFHNRRQPFENRVLALVVPPTVPVPGYIDSPMVKNFELAPEVPICRKNWDRRAEDKP